MKLPPKKTRARTWMAYGVVAVAALGLTKDQASADFGGTQCRETWDFPPGTVGGEIYCNHNGSYGKVVWIKDWGGWDSVHADHLSGPGLLKAVTNYGLSTIERVDGGNNDGSTSVSFPTGEGVSIVCCQANETVPPPIVN